MGESTKIEWARHTFNPWWGCVKVSEACAHCYAETFANRTGNRVWGKDAGRRKFGEKHWNEPLKWDKAAKKAGELHRVFCASMADVFEGRDDLGAERLQLWGLIKRTPNLIWLLLTKRPENILKMVPKEWLAVRGWPSNVWVGTTVETQKWADKRIPELQAVPAPVRFLSIEPLLGYVELGGYISRLGINWVIVGGESGGQARPMDPDWVNAIFYECHKAGVPFFFKQWGEWAPVDDVGGAPAQTNMRWTRIDQPDDTEKRYRVHPFGGKAAYHRWVCRIGKKLAGRKYQDTIWDGVPELDELQMLQELNDVEGL